MSEDSRRAVRRARDGMQRVGMRAVELNGRDQAGRICRAYTDEEKNVGAWRDDGGECGRLVVVGRQVNVSG